MSRTTQPSPQHCWTPWQKICQRPIDKQIFETLVALVSQVVPGVNRGAEWKWNSASSESCWGKREDISDEEVEWGALPRPPSGETEEGRGQVGQRRVVLVPEELQGTPQSVQDRGPPSTVPVTTFPASSGTIRRLVLVQSQQREPISVSTTIPASSGVVRADRGRRAGTCSLGSGAFCKRPFRIMMCGGLTSVRTQASSPGSGGGIVSSKR